MCKSVVRCFAFAVGLAVILQAQATEADTATYSAAPYAAPIRDTAENAIELAKFNNWLNTNYDSTLESNRQSLKEHLYSVIDSHVKGLHREGGAIFPAKEDLVLTQCFTWAARMGVLGAHEVLQELSPSTAEAMGGSGSIPESFTLSLHNEQLRLASTWGSWRVVFPYHFMVVQLRQYHATNGLQTQLAIVSTGFGAHSAGDGHSQATLLIAYSPEGMPKKFVPYWLERYGQPQGVADDRRVSGLPTFKKFDEASNLHTEVVFPKVAKGAMVIGYMGLDGTYGHNRPHFLDFLSHLQLDAGVHR